MAAPPGHASRRCPTSSIPTRPVHHPARGWASGIAGQILHTSDGGQTWTRQTNASRASLYRLFLHEGVPHGVGAGGVVARLEGDTWRTVPYPDAAPVFLGAGIPARTARHHRWRPGWPAARDRHPGRPGFLRFTGPCPLRRIMVSQTRHRITHALHRAEEWIFANPKIVLALILVITALLVRPC
jgi:hypothetical protein